MVFGNLLKPPHLKRFLLALMAGGAAMTVYLTAEHFQVIPGMAALDEEIPAPPALGERSILVVPVAGECPDNFASVLALEAIRQLVRIPELQVISAHSALAPDKAIPGNRTERLVAETEWQLRIPCQEQADDNQYSASLIREGMEEPSWESAGQFTLAQSGELISEIVSGITSEFGITPPGSLEETTSQAAYANYLEARWLLHSEPSRALEAEDLLNGALGEGGDWAPALAARAYARLLQPAQDRDSGEQRLQAAVSDLLAAVKLDSNEPDAHLYLSIIAHRFEWNWSAAYESANRALEHAPGDAAVLVAASTAAFTLGRFDEGTELLHKAIPLDPLALSHRLRYGLMLEFNGQPRAAIEAYRELKIRNQDFPGVHAYLGRALIVGDRIKLALPHMEIERDDFWRMYGTVLALFAMERPEQAEPQFEQFITAHEHEAAIQIAEIKAYSGKIDEAFEWLARAVDQRDPGVGELVGNPLFDNLLDDPRWQALLEELGLADTAVDQ